MHCPKCGKPISSKVNFCPYCGASVLSTSAPLEGFNTSSSTTPILILKPRFIPWVIIVSHIPFQIFFTIWGGGLFGGFGAMAVKALNLSLPLWFPFAFFTCLFFFGIPIVIYIYNKKIYKNTQFCFYNDKMEFYKKGYFTVKEKTIRYNHIKKVYLFKGIFQRICGLGTILLSIPDDDEDTVSFWGITISGIIKIWDIEKPEEAYRQIKELIEKAG